LPPNNDHKVPKSQNIRGRNVIGIINLFDELLAKLLRLLYVSNTLGLPADIYVSSDLMPLQSVLGAMNRALVHHNMASLTSRSKLVYIASCPIILLLKWIFGDKRREQPKQIYRRAGIYCVTLPTARSPRNLDVTNNPNRRR
jgi:hypothetical protein